MSTAEMDASGGRRAATPSNPIGLQRRTQPGATRRPAPFEDGLIDLFGQIMSKLSEASRDESRRSSETSEAEPPRRGGNAIEDSSAENGSVEDSRESAESPREAVDPSLQSPIAPTDQHAVVPFVSTVTASIETHDLPSESRTAGLDRPADEQAADGWSSDTRSSLAQAASDLHRSDADPGKTAESTILDNDSGKGSGGEETRLNESHRGPSQRKQLRLQRGNSLRPEGRGDVPTAKLANRPGTTSTIESAHGVVLKAEAVTTIVESVVPATTAPAAFSGGVAGQSVLASTDLASMRTGNHRSETGRPAMSGIVASGENQSSTGAASASSDSGKNARSEMLARVKLISRVSKAFQHLGRQGGLVRLRLAPAELGTVQVEMQIRQGQVRARVVAETEAATAALREHLPDLRARLESLGMQVERLDVETESSEQAAHSNGDDSGRWQSPGDRRGSSGGFTPRSELRDHVETDLPATTPGSQPIELGDGNSGVDLRV